MDVRELEIFLTLSDLLHFSRASQSCNLSPSALTRTIQRLEQELEQPLFLRNKRKVTLSPAGIRFREYARVSLAEWRNFRFSLKNDQLVSGTLSIYASITAVYSLLPELLESYKDQFPDVQLELRTGAAEEALSQVLSGDIDLAVAALTDGQHSNVEFLPIVTLPLLFIAPKNDMYREDAQLDLSKVPIVLPHTGLSRRRLDQWLKEHRITPNVKSEVTGNEAIISMVRLGCGVGIVPSLVLEKSPFRDDVMVIDKAPSLEPYIVGLCSTKESLLRSTVRAFWTLVEMQTQKTNY